MHCESRARFCRLSGECFQQRDNDCNLLQKKCIDGRVFEELLLALHGAPGGRLDLLDVVPEAGRHAVGNLWRGFRLRRFAHVLTRRVEQVGRVRNQPRNYKWNETSSLSSAWECQQLYFFCRRQPRTVLINFLTRIAQQRAKRLNAPHSSKKSLRALETSLCKINGKARLEDVTVPDMSAVAGSPGTAPLGSGLRPLVVDFFTCSINCCTDGGVFFTFGRLKWTVQFFMTIPHNESCVNVSAMRAWFPTRLQRKPTTGISISLVAVRVLEAACRVACYLHN